jgi:threonylcarbamoyladenosine tRNA methylthiotransferase MtaB
MGRHWYSAEHYAAAVERLVVRAPIFALSADLITGFPGERDDDHAMTVALVRTLPFTSLHVFPYSERPGTAAARLPEPVAPYVARERAAELRAIASAKVEAHRRARVGGEADVVVVREGVGARGLTEDYLDVGLGAGAPPRASRFRATLVARGGELRAEALEPVAR